MPFPVPNLPQNIGHSRGTVPILFSSFDPILVTDAAITKSAGVRVARRFIRPSTRASKSARATRQTISRPIDFPLDISRILV